jgi:hypothetical protein
LNFGGFTKRDLEQAKKELEEAVVEGREYFKIG